MARSTTRKPWIVIALNKRTGGIRHINVGSYHVRADGRKTLITTPAQALRAHGCNVPPNALKRETKRTVFTAAQTV